MKSLTPKIILILIFAIFTYFFTNNMGVVDIEKMAIITAIGIDIDQDEYSITAQIAVPEEDSTSTEKRKTHLTGKGVTVGDAIKSISDVSGWYPQLIFCNLIVIGEDFEQINVITVLDFFAKTLRIQDSALVVMADGKAKDLLSNSSPLDNISSFALQKILHKKSGFNKDVAEVNVKDFCTGYYGRSASSFMPIVKTVKQENSSDSSSSQQSNNGGSNQIGGMSGTGASSSSGSQGSVLFDVKNTALFKNGIKVGELDEESTATLNLLSDNFSESTIPLKDVNCNLYNKCNYLITIIKNDKSLNLEVEDEEITLKVKLNLFCKISDQNSTFSDTVLSKNTPLPPEVKDAIITKLNDNIYTLFQKIKQTDCDLLNLDKKLFKYHNKHYRNSSDNLLESMKVNVEVNVEGHN